MIGGYIVVVIQYCASRFAEAIMDAEQFEHPKESRSKLWHQLKYPRALGLFASGYYVNEYGLYSISFLTLFLIAGYIFMGWLVFEKTLKYYRSKG